MLSLAVALTLFGAAALKVVDQVTIYSLVVASLQVVVGIALLSRNRRAFGGMVLSCACAGAGVGRVVELLRVDDSLVRPCGCLGAVPMTSGESLVLLGIGVLIGDWIRRGSQHHARVA